mmetsp:Transcript_28023/g.68115  ORF Transcript_28023/g.68115 Transcript_28023/m.68115 type:complete len:415 (-) Transcript_28023:313-1557(-)|eukprot:CAMPEP_0114503794 /NCGR_PEP_ID=MMETSP0109-20121206/9845_1 /TAXON_ID=29199 /ORGANISM="Chlorarachnion reptans, Strain CCCM449" /LENGTH=414 /DNA_ID=CAMNT_0001681861 /DNA_START=144 /DNA_END=1388 /DNA_ORIENTATION=+
MKAIFNLKTIQVLQWAAIAIALTLFGGSLSSVNTSGHSNPSSTGTIKTDFKSYVYAPNPEFESDITTLPSPPEIKWKEAEPDSNEKEDVTKAPENMNFKRYKKVVKKVLENEDYLNFFAATGHNIDDILEELSKEEDSVIREIASNKKLVAHRLNAKGLHALRAVVGERIFQTLRKERGSVEHPLYEKFMRDGILVFPNIDRVNYSIPKQIYEIPGFREILDTVSGYTHHGEPAFHPFKTHVHFPDDVQFYLHVDTFHPIHKIFVFKETPIQNGPFHYVIGSHRNTEGKIRWLYDMSHNFTNSDAFENDRPGENMKMFQFKTHGGSFRYPNYDPTNIGKVQESLASYGMNPITPMVTGKGITLVVVDTSGFHSRGYAEPGMKRTAARYKGGGQLPRKNTFRCYERMNGPWGNKC